MKISFKEVLTNIVLGAKMTVTEKYVDLEKLIEEDFLKVIGLLLTEVQLRNYEGIQSHLISSFCKDYLMKRDLTLITDTNYLYRSIWKSIIAKLYSTYLPLENFEFNWSIEKTPHSLFLWMTAGRNLDYYELDKLLKHYGISNDEIESNFESCLCRMKLDECNLTIEDFELIPQSLNLNSNKEKLALFFSIMNIPPLEEIYLFFEKYKNLTQSHIISLNNILNIDKENISLELDIPPILINSYNYFDYHLFSEKSWSDIFSDQCFDQYRQDINEIEEKSLKYNGEFKDRFLCSCCGEESKVLIPQDAIKIKLLSEKRSLYRHLGMIYFDRYVSSFFSSVLENVKDFQSALNSTSHPDCLILVEGESEEVFLSILAMRLNIDLKFHKVKIYNSKSKQKLLSDFISFKEKYPKLKIVCLLDSDAKKEKEAIERIIVNKLDKYRLIYIKKGAFEDLFDTEISLDVVNKLFPNGGLINLDDLDKTKEFAKSIDKVLFERKNEKFDKVKFSKQIAYSIDIKETPIELKKAVEFSLLLTKKSKYLKK